MQNWEFAKNREDLKPLFVSQATPLSPVDNQSKPTNVAKQEINKPEEEPEGNFIAGIEISAEILDKLITGGSGAFLIAAQKKFSLGYNEASALTDLCKDYYEQNGHWPDGHVTQLKIKK